MTDLERLQHAARLALEPAEPLTPQQAAEAYAPIQAQLRRDSKEDATDLFRLAEVARSAGC